MAFTPQLEPGEKLIRQFVITTSKKAVPFHFAVSDQALYWPGKKLIALTDPYYFQRIPGDRVQQVSIQRLSSHLSWVLAGIMVAAGLFTCFWMFEPFINKVPGEHRVSGWPFAIVVGGILLPWASRNRLRFQVTTSDKTFSWKTPFAVDGASKERIATTLDEILQTCRDAQLRVIDGRQAGHPYQ